MANGRRIPYTPISVDYFQRGSLPSRTLYFLTHAHADHLYGLDSSFDQIIYCTSLTKQLLLLYIPSLDPDILEEIDYDEPRQIHIDCPGYVVITVTAIDAQHCPGSAMFLFQGYFGTILHTGDFRLTPKLASHSLICNLQPDTLFLDNTYNDPIFDFPERSVSYEAVTKIIMSSPDKRTFLAFNKLGKEDLLQEIAQHTGYMIGVSEEQYRKMEALGLSNICSLDCAQCQVIVVPFYAVTEANLIRWTSECPTQVIIPTCRYIGREHLIPKHPSITVVHHSDHCSYKELYQFVKLVKPVNIQPIVQRKDVCNISAFTPLLSKRPHLKYEVPSGVSQVLYTRGRSSKDISLYPSTRSPNVSKIRVQKIPKGVQFISPKKNKHKHEMESREIEVKEMECVEKLSMNISPNYQNISFSNSPTCVNNKKAIPELVSSTQTLAKKIQETCIQLSLDQLQCEAEMTCVTPYQVKDNILQTLMVEDLKDQSKTVTRSLAIDQLKCEQRSGVVNQQN